MHDEQLIVKTTKKRKYNSYKCEISPEVDNVINRDFSAPQPNQKWLTDITEFHIPAGKVYLSPIIDCFDGMAVSWTIGTSPNAELVNTMLEDAIRTLNISDHPLVHSDRGCHYRWPDWIQIMDTAELTRSMSKKGCSPDNSACEGFFGRLKNEMFYNRNWNRITIDSLIEELDEYMHWYNEERIKMSLGGMSPLEYRRSLGIAIQSKKTSAPPAHELKAEFNTDNPFTLAQYYGFRVCLTSGNPDVFKAHTVKLDGYPTIISINQAFSHTGKVFLSAHELGHALLHNNSINHFDPSGRGITTSDYEYEANLFAVALLVDEQKLNMPLRHMSNAVLKRIIDYNLQ